MFYNITNRWFFQVICWHLSCDNKQLPLQWVARALHLGVALALGGVQVLLRDNGAHSASGESHFAEQPTLRSLCSHLYT